MSVDAYFWRVSLLLIYFVGSWANAQDDTRTENKLPLNTVLDGQGNPIVLTDTKKPAMTYTYASAHQEITSTKKTKIQPRKKKRFKDLSRKEMLSSRANVANDPSCHWLNQRMNQLDRTLMRTMDGMDMRFGYHKKELAARKKEWVCLKCGVEGPNIHDYSKCQFNR